MSSNPPQGYPVTRAQPDDNKNQQYWTGLQAVLAVLARGVPRAVRTLTSLRVGSGAATGAILDGTDGAIIADGASAILFVRDRADSTKFGALYKNGTLRLNTTEGGDLWLIDKATGQITQPAWTNATLLNSWVAFGSSYATPGWRKVLPTNEVVLRGVIKSGTATAGTVLFTISDATARPTWQHRQQSNSAGASCSIEVTTAGNVILGDAGGANIALDGIRFPLS